MGVPDTTTDPSWGVMTPPVHMLSFAEVKMILIRMAVWQMEMIIICIWCGRGVVVQSYHCRVSGADDSHSQT